MFCCLLVSLVARRYSLFHPLLQYLHTDVVETELFDRSTIRLFIEGVVSKFAPEHFNRISQNLFAARIIAPSVFGKDLEKHAWANPLFSDVEFEVADESGSTVRFTAHRSIICSRSQFFHAMCLGGLRESRERVIKITQTSPVAFKAVLQFLYSRIVDFEAVEEFIVDLLMAARFYQVSELRTLLEGVICQSVTMENVASLLITADQVEAEKLKEVCRNFIIANEAALQKVPEFLEEVESVKLLMRP